MNRNYETKKDWEENALACHTSTHMLNLMKEREREERGGRERERERGRDREGGRDGGGREPFFR